MHLFIGVEGFTTEEDQELLSRIEKQIKRRFIIGSQVSEHAIIQDFTRQVTTIVSYLHGLNNLYEKFKYLYLPENQVLYIVYPLHEDNGRSLIVLSG